MKILLIIPAYNEADNILILCNNIKQYNEDRKNGLKIDYVVINDGSKDNTLDICKENNLNYIDLISNLGIGGAVQAGYKYAFQNNYDIAVQFDGDGQHDISYVPIICKPIINKECDMCIGSRYLTFDASEFKSTFMRRVGKNIISIIIRLFCGVKITDPTSGFRGANRDIIKMFSNDYPSDYPEPESIVNLLKHDLKIIEIPVSMNERQGGKSSINLWRSIYYMIKVSIAIIIESIKTKKDKVEKYDINNT